MRQFRSFEKSRKPMKTYQIPKREKFTTLTASVDPNPQPLVILTSHRLTTFSLSFSQRTALTTMRTISSVAFSTAGKMAKMVGWAALAIFPLSLVTMMTSSRVVLEAQHSPHPLVLVEVEVLPSQLAPLLRQCKHYLT